MNDDEDLAHRAAMHHALGDPSRLAVVDALAFGEASPVELQSLLAMPSNLLAHHVQVLVRAGIVRRTRSEGDRRRTYLGLTPGALDALVATVGRSAPRVVFVCTQNSARSQLAAAMWNAGSPVPATSAGTRPAPRVHPGALAAARRHGVALTPTAPRRAADVLRPDDLVITVCDQAHEELGAAPGTAHWSVADPARDGDVPAFDAAVTDLAGRISRLAPTVHPTAERSA
ncbi:helix-turn-helix domain-containing protein [Pseudonocardia sp.]|uniref:arsenate reductase/protein-tyrosine-phosphatase family protein n=1 Tax=Pseudonocardia sp. TaxID=60912 RepID=UPI0026369856|nr:helix-turn-helix domain-containing protein [Pseudonocardia sp.]